MYTNGLIATKITGRNIGSGRNSGVTVFKRCTVLITKITGRNTRFGRNSGVNVAMPCTVRA